MRSCLMQCPPLTTQKKLSFLLVSQFFQSIFFVSCFYKLLLLYHTWNPSMSAVCRITWVLASSYNTIHVNTMEAFCECLWCVDSVAMLMSVWWSVACSMERMAQPGMWTPITCTRVSLRLQGLPRSFMAWSRTSHINLHPPYVIEFCWITWNDGLTINKCGQCNCGFCCA